MRITHIFKYYDLHKYVMGRHKSSSQRKPFALRIPQEVINDSKAIPLFRKNLEDKAIAIHTEWKKKELLLNG